MTAIDLFRCSSRRCRCAVCFHRDDSVAYLAGTSAMLTASYFMLRDGVEHHDLGVAVEAKAA
jgi:hypothetical protein